MFTKEQASAIRKEFWTKLGQYLGPMPSASGEKVNWINYRTGVKAIQFKMDADAKSAIVYIRISSKEREQDQRLFSMFQNFKEQMTLEDEWLWEEEFTDEYGKTFSRISCLLKPANIFQKEQWPAMISFFKKHMIALDRFWEEHKDFFEMHAE
jgi:hypothetical protein